jgi:hypothetical protein
LRIIVETDTDPAVVGRNSIAKRRTENKVGTFLAIFVFYFDVCHSEHIVCLSGDHSVCLSGDHSVCLGGDHSVCLGCERIGYNYDPFGSKIPT